VSLSDLFGIYGTLAEVIIDELDDIFYDLYEWLGSNITGPALERFRWLFDQGTNIYLWLSAEIADISDEVREELVKFIEDPEKYIGKGLGYLQTSMDNTYAWLSGEISASEINIVADFKKTLPEELQPLITLTEEINTELSGTATKILGAVEGKIDDTKEGIDQLRSELPLAVEDIKKSTGIDLFNVQGAVLGGFSDGFGNLSGVFGDSLAKLAEQFNTETLKQLPAFGGAVQEVLGLSPDKLQHLLDALFINSPEMKSDPFQRWKEKSKASWAATGRDTKTILNAILVEPWGIMHEAIVNWIVPEQKPTYETAMESAEHYLALSGDINVVMGVIDLVAAIYSLGQLKSITNFMKNIVWTFGLGWLSWIVLGVPFRKAIAEPMENHYVQLWRTRKSTISELRRWFEDGIISEGEYRVELGEIGVPDVIIERFLEENLLKIQKVIEREEAKSSVERIRTATISQVNRMYREGILEKTGATERLKIMSPPPTDQYISDLFSLWDLQITEDRIKEQSRAQREREKENRDLTLSQITRAFREGLYTKEKMIEQLTILGFDRDERKVLIEVEEKKIADQKWVPSVAQIGRWFKNGQINEERADEYWKKHQVHSAERKELFEEYARSD
jgi:hypothetical protein